MDSGDARFVDLTIFEPCPISIPVVVVPVVATIQGVMLGYFRCDLIPVLPTGTI